MVISTCCALEVEFVDVFARIPSSDGPKMFAVGPLNSVLLPGATRESGTRDTSA
jgi:cis-zeatin O-glucosyltransferase